MLKKRWLSLVATSCTLVALGLISVGQASAAVMGQPNNTAFVAIYGNPGSNGTTLPVGGGLGRNFGFGENVLFEACGGCSPVVGENLFIKVGGTEAEAKESFIGGTLMSNKTGVNNPVSFSVQSVDLQDSEVKGVGLEPTYSDTSDRPWLSEICPPETGAEVPACRVDARIPTNARGDVKVENVSINIGPAFVVQGTLWGTWIQGTATTPACIALKTPPVTAVAADTLWATQSPGAPFPAVGSELEAIKGKVCVISANNDYYEGHKEAITLKNTA